MRATAAAAKAALKKSKESAKSAFAPMGALRKSKHQQSSSNIYNAFSPRRASPRRVQTRSHSQQKVSRTNDKDVRSCGTSTNNKNSPEQSFVTCMSKREPSFITARS